MNLILVRHGETDWNDARRWQGQLDIPLNSKGEWQAQQVAKALAGEPIQRLICSDLQRARATAEPLAAALGLPLIADVRWREFCYGEWQGMSFDEIKEQDGTAYRQWRANPFLSAPPGGESLIEAGRRTALAWQDIVEAGAQTVALVAHGGTLRLLLSQLLELEAARFWQMKLGNANISKIRIEPSGPLVVSINDVQHLQEVG